MVVLSRKTSSAPPKGKRTLNKQAAWERYSTGLYLSLAFFIPFILMFMAFKVAGVEPFGTNQILVTDLWHQYYPFLADFQSKLQSGGSLLWTWKSGGGTNYVALMSYYLASPLNFLSVFVPASGLKIFLYIITCVKIGLAGLFFAVFLRITFKRSDLSLTAFGVMYALCAYIMGYYWNVIWLDTIALLPLVIAGTFALLRHGRFKLYIIALALSILANYYIGLFTCVFVLLVSVAYCLTEYRGWRNLIGQFFKMAGCSLIAIMMSAVLTLPAYFALGHTHSSDNTFPEAFAINIGSTADLGGVLEGIGKTIANSVAFIQPTAKEGLPNVYCGVFTVFLAILFLFCHKIKKRERFFCGGLLAFFMLSFIIRQLDYVWHGFHFPNMLPYRFSFLYSFVVIYMAFRVFMYIDSLRLSSVIAGICGFMIYLGVAFRYYDGTTVILSPILNNAAETGDAPAPDPILLSAFLGIIIAAWVLLYALRDRIPRIATVIGAGVIGLAAAGMVMASGSVLDAALTTGENKSHVSLFVVIIIILATGLMAMLLSSKELNRDHKITKVCLSVVLLVLALTEGLFSAAGGVKTVSVTDATTYPLGTTDTLDCVSYINTLEQDRIDLPHAEVNKYHTLNDNALIGINGISMFNSMVNKDITNYMEKFGLCGWVASNRYTYQESSPFTNLMLNLKYLIAPYGAYLDTTHNTLIHQSGYVKLMQANYYLPQGFMVKSDLLDYNAETAGINPIENQKQFFNLATGISGDIYEYIDLNTVECGTEGASIGVNSPGSYTYSSPENSGSYQLNYVAPRNGVAVAYFDTYYSDNVSLRVNDSEVISYYVKRPFIMMLGDVKAGDKVSLQTTITGSTSGSITAYCAMFNEELFQQAYDQFGRATLSATKVTDTEITGNIHPLEDGLFYTSISYIDGWHAYVDGEEVEITPVGNALLAFPLSAGAHVVSLQYTPEGFRGGLLISILGVVLFIALIILSRHRDKLTPVLRRCLPARTTAPAAGEEPDEAAPEQPDVTVPKVGEEPADNHTS